MDPRPPRGKARFGHDWCRSRRFQLNDGVSPVPDRPDSGYRLAPALGFRLVGRSLVSLAVLVAVATVMGLLVGTAWVAIALGGVGALLVATWAWWLLRRAEAVRLSAEGYDVRLLRGVGTTTAAWAEVVEVVAASPGGTPCLVLRRTDGRGTRLPVTALAGDPDTFARDVRRRVRDAHSRAQDLPAEPSGDLSEGDLC